MFGPFNETAKNLWSKFQFLFLQTLLVMVANNHNYKINDNDRYLLLKLLSTTKTIRQIQKMHFKVKVKQKIKNNQKIATILSTWKKLENTI